MESMTLSPVHGPLSDKGSSVIVSSLLNSDGPEGSESVLSFQDWKARLKLLNIRMGAAGSVCGVAAVSGFGSDTGGEGAATSGVGLGVE